LHMMQSGYSCTKTFDFAVRIAIGFHDGVAESAFGVLARAVRALIAIEACQARGRIHGGVGRLGHGW